jgi:pimeloyl-ACP methyl ester carboxylesterase
VISLLITLVVCYTVWMGVALVIQGRMIFPGAWMLEAGPEPSPASGATVLRRDIGDGRSVEAIFVPPVRVWQGPAPLIVIFHGNGELIDDYLSEAQALAIEGFAVLLPEYRGYGRSQGSPGKSRITDDAAHFVDLVAADARVDQARTIYIGRSLGGAVAADLARTRPPKALVLESTFTDMASMFRRAFLPPFVVRHPYDTAEVLREYNGDLLIIHGSGDKVVPPSHSNALARLRPDARYFEPVSGHYPSISWSEYDSTLSQFLGDSGLLPKAPASPAEESAE